MTDTTTTDRRCADVRWNVSSSVRCKHVGTHEEGGKWWCGTHAPSRIQARRDKRREARDAQWQAEKATRDAPYVTIASLRAENAELVEALRGAVFAAPCDPCGAHHVKMCDEHDQPWPCGIERARALLARLDQEANSAASTE